MFFRQSLARSLADRLQHGHGSAGLEDAVDDREEVVARLERLDALAQATGARKAPQVHARELPHREGGLTFAPQRRGLLEVLDEDRASLRRRRRGAEAPVAQRRRAVRE